MYHGYPIYPYLYYYGHTPTYDPNMMSRHYQGEYQQELDAVLAGVKRQAAMIDLYSRLAHAAPNETHKNEMLYAVEDKKVHMKQLADFYTILTGEQPVYQIENITFRTYQEGLQKAYEAEVMACEEHQKNYWLAQHLAVRDVFLHAFHNEVQHMERLGYLYEDVMKPLQDFGGKPFVFDIEKATMKNNNYRTALWTGKHLQMTLMSIEVGGDIGLEVHPTVDQFIRIEQGEGLVQMGDRKDQLNFAEKVYDDYAILIPAGKWHNVINTGNQPMKLYAIYAPPEHPFGTVHETKAIAMAAEEG